jgi:hypothetical protein
VIWRDPIAEHPPLRTRIRLRLSDDFRAAHGIKDTCLDGYLIEPNSPPMSGFSTVLGPHVTGWMPVTPWVDRGPGRDDPLDRTRGALDAIGAKLAEKRAAPRTWYGDRQEEA